MENDRFYRIAPVHGPLHSSTLEEFAMDAQGFTREPGPRPLCWACRTDHDLIPHGGKIFCFDCLAVKMLRERRRR